MLTSAKMKPSSAPPVVTMPQTVNFLAKFCSPSSRTRFSSADRFCPEASARRPYLTPRTVNVSPMDKFSVSAISLPTITRPGAAALPQSPSTYQKGLFFFACGRSVPAMM